MNTINGFLNYQEKEYLFSFADFELMIWERDDVVPGAPFRPMGDVLQAIKDGDITPIVWGTCFPDGHLIALIDVKPIGFHNNEKIFSVRQFIEYQKNYSDKPGICALSFDIDEMNYIYPVQQAYTYEFGNDVEHKKSVVVNQDRCSNTWHFTCDGLDVSAVCYYSQQFNHNDNPITIRSTLHFSFSQTDDLKTISKLAGIGKSFVQYICYRQNINIRNVTVHTLADGKHCFSCGKFDAAWLNEIDGEKIDRYYSFLIPIGLITNGVEYILQGIADNTIYREHIPESSRDARRMTASRILLLSSAFEWEYKQIYLKNVSKKQKQPELRIKLETAFSDHIGCIDKIATEIFAMNSMSFDYKRVSARIKKVRNEIIHGDPSITFDTETVICFTLVPYLLYAVQFRDAGFDDDQIRQILQHLFRRPMV